MNVSRNILLIGERRRFFQERREFLENIEVFFGNYSTKHSTKLLNKVTQYSAKFYTK
jgi:hypothetical protein